MIRAVLFDLDGTLWENPVRWDELRKELGLPWDSLPIYLHVQRFPKEKREQAEAYLRAKEAEGVKFGRLKPGAQKLLEFLRTCGVYRVLVTNNSRESVEGVLRLYPLPFDLVWTREDGALKPDPEAFLAPLRQLGVRPEEAAVVGDTHLDLQAACSAGIAVVILINPADWARQFFPKHAQFWEVQTIEEAQKILASSLCTPSSSTFSLK